MLAILFKATSPEMSRFSFFLFFILSARKADGSAHESRLFLSSGFKYSPTRLLLLSLTDLWCPFDPACLRRLEADTLALTVFRPVRTKLTKRRAQILFRPLIFAGGGFWSGAF